MACYLTIYRIRQKADPRLFWNSYRWVRLAQAAVYETKAEAKACLRRSAEDGEVKGYRVKQARPKGKTFSQALVWMQQGGKARRPHWNAHVCIRTAEHGLLVLCPVVNLDNCKFWTPSRESVDACDWELC